MNRPVCRHTLDVIFAQTLEPTSTAFWPADWSQMLPDIVVAVITGVVVGLTVLWVERSRADSRERLEAQQRRVSVVDSVSGTIDESFIHAYPIYTLLPDRKVLRVIRKRVAAVPPWPQPAEIVPAFVFLRAIVEQYEAIPLAVERIEARLDVFVPSKEDSEQIYAYFQSFTMSPDLPWMMEPIHVHPNIRNAIAQDRELEEAVRSYGRAGRFLELAREAFVTVDRGWRADAWEVALQETQGAPRFVRRWIRRRRANRRRRNLSERWMQAGREIMARGGTWFEPRGW